MKARLPQLQSQLGWHSRGYLPHFDGGELAQFITFRLYDSLPVEVLIRWKEELKIATTPQAESIMRRRVEAYLDQGRGNCYLRNQNVAALVQNTLLFHDQHKYRLIAWVVMPNHVHVLCTPFPGQSLASIMHSIKSFSSSEATRSLNVRDDFGRRNISTDLFATRAVCEDC